MSALSITLKQREEISLQFEVSKKLRNDVHIKHDSHIVSVEKLYSKLSGQLDKFIEEGSTNSKFESPNSSPSQRADDESISDATSSDSSNKSKESSKFERIEKQLRELQDNLQIDQSMEDLDQSVLTAANVYIQSLETKAKGIESKISTLRRKLEEIEKRNDEREEPGGKFPSMVLDKALNVLEVNSLCRKLLKLDDNAEIKHLHVNTIIAKSEQEKVQILLQKARRQNATHNLNDDGTPSEIFVECLFCDEHSRPLIMKIRFMPSASNENHDRLHALILPSDVV